MKETLDLREREGIVRPDMLQLLIDTRKGRLSNQEESSSNVVTDAGFAQG